MTVHADIHLHSCLSPCGDLSMSPRALVEAAVRAGLSLIALTDHNTARNAPAFAAACSEAGIVPLFGAEATSSEEAHVLGIFGDLESGLEFGERLYATLPEFAVDPARYGDQVVVDPDEMVIEVLAKGLISASTYSLRQLGELIHELGGLFIPAHIDRSSFSIWSQLGFLPPDSYDAVEIYSNSNRIAYGGYTAICNSDAHFPADVARRHFSFEADEPSFRGLQHAIADGAIARHGV
ncbi:MAG: PHP domain-containing protein [Spirochaetota bacterium]